MRQALDRPAEREADRAEGSLRVRLVRATVGFRPLRRVRRVTVGGALLAVLAAGCAATSAPSIDGPPCATARFQIDDDFERGAFASCRAASGGAARLVIRPEAGATNDSAWYAFRVRAREGEVVKVDLAYEGGTHRYWPKTSVDGRAWTRMPASDVRAAKDGAGAAIKVRMRGPEMFVSAQPLETLHDAIARVDAPLRAKGFAYRQLGESADGRPLHAYESIPPEARRLVVLLARQHPPETTGASAFEAFLARVIEDDAAAREFRLRHAILVVPMVNPDGFVRGHWRGNAAGVDVNRDWGPFQTPEARAVSQRIAELAADIEPALFADFHSTKRDVIYAAPEGRAEGRLADALFARLVGTLGDRAPEISRSHVSARTTAKAWSLETLGVAGFTYEVADEADLDVARATARIAAQCLIDAALEAEE